MTYHTVARILHGSHLFGTSTENSDTDFKSVVLPSRADILLGRVDWSINESADGAPPNARPNTRFDVDEERHDLLRFVNLLAAGQPMALEMLFAPREFHRVEPHPVWQQLHDNLDRVVSRQSGKFLGYCQRQAMVYGLKGERVKAAEMALAEIDRLVAAHGLNEPLGPHIDGIVAAVMSEHVCTEGRTLANGREIMHLRVCGKMAAATVNLDFARNVAAGVVRDYGTRAQRSKSSQGNDWKALSHALRIGYEAVELFSEGRITLPRPESTHLVAVKSGQVEAEAVGEEIVSLLARVEQAAKSSPLAEQADMEYLEGLVMEVHAETVTAGCDSAPRQRP